MTDPREQFPKSKGFTMPTSRWGRSGVSLLLTVVCCFVGYGFYQMNHRDTINAVFFTIGLLGIMLSVLRRAKPRN